MRNEGNELLYYTIRVSLDKYDEKTTVDCNTEINMITINFYLAEAHVSKGIRQWPFKIPNDDTQRLYLVVATFSYLT